MAFFSGLLWAIKVICGAVAIALAAGIVIITVGVAVEAAWVLRHENRKKYEEGEKK